MDRAGLKPATSARTFPKGVTCTVFYSCELPAQVSGFADIFLTEMFRPTGNTDASHFNLRFHLPCS